MSSPATRRRHHDADHEEHENHERWLVSYADMMTLLMVLFVVLFAMGTTDVRKFNAFKDSFKTTEIGPAPVLKGGLGVLDADNAVQLVPTVNHAQTASPTKAMTSQSLQAAAEQATLAAAEKAIEAALTKAGLADDVRFGLDPSGLRVTVATDRVLFAPGSALLLPSGAAIVDTIAPTLAGLPNQITVEGHTDDTPVAAGGPFPSNWELSTARATAVLHRLIDAHGVAATRLSAAGYADTRPLVPDDSAAHRAENRRVEIIVQPFTLTPASPTTSTPTPQR